MKKVNVIKMNMVVILMVLFLTPWFLSAEEKDRELPEKYTVKEGDTLWDISNQFYEDPFLWPGIWGKNKKIINPDLIYPGNTILLKDLFPSGLPEKPEKTTVKVKKPAKTTVKVKKKVKITREKIARAVIPALPEKVSVTSLSIFRTAGFIARNDLHSGSIINSQLEGRTLMSRNDIVYTDIGPGGKASIGKKFVIYRLLREVEHPVTREEMGSLIKIIGELEIKAFKENRSEALITESYEEISKGDFLSDRIELEVPLIDPSALRPEKDIKGYLVAAKRGANTSMESHPIGLHDIVYLDVGSNRGVVAGDRFIAFRIKEEKEGIFTQKTVFQYPRRIIGELKIISTRDETATALITKSSQELEIGEKVEYILPEKGK